MTRTSSRPGVPLRIGGFPLRPSGGPGGPLGRRCAAARRYRCAAGSIAAGDIGSFFAGDPRWKNADSAIFLNLALETLQRAGYRIVNIDNQR